MKLIKFWAYFIKRIKKRVNIDQNLSSKNARKSMNILVFLFDFFYATIRYGCKIKNHSQ